MVPTVAVVRCDSYADRTVASAISNALCLIGGMKAFVKPNDRVLIKPNLLSASAPDRAITTHPAVVKAVVREIQAAGGIPIIADSPGGPFDRRFLELVYGVTGMSAVSKETGAALNVDTGSFEASNPDGRLVKRLDLMGVLNDVDTVITLPKMKTHVLTQFTGATKILFGVVPGLTKPVYHMKFQDVWRFSDMLLDILCYVKPSLSIMDAVVGLEGDGPGAHGTPMKVGLILAGSDSVALDVVASAIAGMDPLDVPIIRRAAERGLTSGRLSDVNVAGVRIEDVRVAFKRPSQAGGIMGAVLRLPVIRSSFLGLFAQYPAANDRCVRCGVCVKSCPMKAITIGDIARMDLRKCIRCYCCHELCPHGAVTLKSPILGRLFFRSG